MNSLSFLYTVWATLVTLNGDCSTNHEAVSADNATYLSAETNKTGIRSRLEFTGINFRMSTVMGLQDTDPDSHEGGQIRLSDRGIYYRIDGLGLTFPKGREIQWSTGKVSCHKTNLKVKRFFVKCVDKNNNTMQNYEYDEQEGMIMFTGYCNITSSRRCLYLKSSKKGVTLDIK